MAEAYQVSTGVVALIPSAKGFGQAVSKEIGGDLAKAGSEGGDKFGGRFGDSLKKWGKRGAIAAGAGVGAAFGTALVKGFGRLKAIEAAESKLTGLGHSAESVEKIMTNATAAVRGTSFGLGDAASAAASAVAAGVKPGEELERTLTLVGDAAAIAGADYGEMASIFNKVSAGGIIQGEELAQLGDRGIPILQLLGEELGVSAQEVRKLASEGKIDFETFQDAMEAGMGGAAQESGKTFSGAMANVGAALGRVGANLLSGVFPKIAPALQKVIEWLGPMESVAAKAGAAIGDFLTRAVSGGQALFDLFVKGDFTGKFREAFGVEEDSQLVGFLFGLRDTVINVFGEIRGGITAFAAAWKYNDGEVTSSGLPGFMEKVGYWARQTFDYVRSTVIPAAIDLAKWLYENRNTLVLLGAAVLGGVVAFKAFMFIRTVIAAVKAARLAVIAFNAVLKANPIGIVVTAIGVLVGALVWLYKNNETARRIMDAAWAKIQGAISAVASWVRDKAVPWLVGAFRTAGDRAVGLKDRAVDAFQKITGGISTAYEGAKRVLDRFKAGLDSLRDKAVSVKDGIGRVWSTLGAAFAKPINTVIDTVNRFLENVRSNLNKIPGVDIGGNWGVIPHVPVPAGSTSSASTAGSGRGGRGAVRLADGMWVPGSSPHSRADNIPALLTAQEFVTRQWAALRMKRKHPGALEYINRYGELPRFADGGTVGREPRTGGALDKAWGFVTDLWQRGKGWVKDLFDQIMPDFGGSWAGMAAKGAIGALDLGRVAEVLKEKALGALGGSNASMTGGQRVNYGGGFGWAPRGIGSSAMRSMLAAIAPEARVTSGYRPGAITASGIRSLHSMDRAIDIVSGNMRETFMKLLAAVGGTASQLYYSPMGGLQIGYRDAAVHRMHFDHIHWGYADGGPVKPVKPFVADSGVTLAPGINVLDNRLGKPEPLGRTDQMHMPETITLVDASGALLGRMKVIASDVVAGHQDRLDYLARGAY